MNLIFDFFCWFGNVEQITDAIMWHPSNEMLIALTDKSLYVWYYPTITWSDPDLLKRSCISIDATTAGLNARITSIQGSIVHVRKANGVPIILNISCLPLLVYESIYSGDWSKALRLCRASNISALWCLVVGLAIEQNQIDSALQALSALDEPDKFLFLKRISCLPIKV